MNFTAHIKEGGMEEQSVWVHLMNTSVLSSEYAKKLEVSSMAKLQGILHDVGKLTGDFNDYIHGASKYKKGEIDHSFAGAKYLFEISEKTGNRNLIETARIISHTIISHHGLHDWLKEDGEDYFVERILEQNRYSESVENLNQYISEEKIKEILLKASEEYSEIISKIKILAKSEKKDKETFLFYIGMFERVFQSFLIDADRTDTASFMSGKNISSFQNVSWKKMKYQMEEKIKSFSDRKDKISVQRMSISERCAKFADHKVGICRLIVPTGGGKTLSSLRFALEYCAAYDMDRIFYIAPFMSILEQNSDEIRSVTGDEFFLEHHSNIIQEIESDEELSDYELKTEKWNSPVIATTMVQFLNTLFSDKTTSVRRMHQLCRSVIIIDEIQSVPLKCVNLFNLAMNFLSQICGCTIVLCSATQPVFNITDYPMKYDERMDMTGDYVQDFEVFRRTVLIPSVIPGGYSYESSAEFCCDKYYEHGSLLVVVNTKLAASSIYKCIKERNIDNVDVIHLSTNMCPQHRKDIICKIRDSLNNNRNIICVTTQLIEAGVDISFGCVVRSAAGMDNAAQAAGRCNRHGEKGKICPVYVINISEENLSRLPEIKHSQDISLQIFDSSRFEDYLSPETMEAYFIKLYNNEKNSLSYTLKDKNVTLLELLSTNKKCWDIFKKREIMCSSHAFKTAGKRFEVIGNDTISVIVPYNDEANEIILELNSDISADSVIELSRKSQKYTVSIYSGMFGFLKKNNALLSLKCGALALEKRFFDDETGINSEGAAPDLLIF